MMDKSDDRSAGGLREDIERLLQAFLLKQTVRYQMFAEEWRKHNFSFIHYAIERRQERKETMYEAFRIATDYFLPPYEMQYRVGALYILYALYETQPYTPKFKIRMCLKHWQDVKSLIESLEGQGHLDALYVFNQLKMNKAFMFTAMPKKMIFHSSYMELKPEQNPTERWLDRHRHSLMTESFDDGTLEVNHEVHQQYKKKKVDLGLHDNTSLMLVKESISEYIVKRFEKLEASFEASQESAQTTETSDPDHNDHGSRVSQIKKHSYATVAKASKSRRHRQQAAESLPKETPTKSKSKKSKPKRGGLRKYTITNTAIELSEDSSNGSWSPRRSKKHKASPKVVKASPEGLTRKEEYSVPDEEAMLSERTDDLEGTEEALQQDFIYFPNPSKVHDLIARPEEENEAQLEGSVSVKSDDDVEADVAQGVTNIKTLSSSNEVCAASKDQTFSPTPKKGTAKKSKSSEPPDVSNLECVRTRKDSASVSPEKTVTGVALRKSKESEKSKTEGSERGRPSRRQTKNSPLEITPTKTKVDKKERSKRGGPSQRQTRSSSPEITPTKMKNVQKERSKRGGPSQRQTRSSSLEITPTKTNAVQTERSKRGRARKETLATTPEESNRSPEDTPKKKQKTADKNNPRGSESSKVSEGCDLAVQGSKTKLKVRGGRTGARTRGSKRR